MRVLFLVNIPSPYRVSFFNELGKYCDLTVIFERYQSSEREEEWHNYNFKTFKALFLGGIKVGANSGFDYRIIQFLDDEIFDVIIVGNYSSPNGILAIKYLNNKTIPFIISVDGGIIKYNESMLKHKFKTKLISSADAWLSTGEATTNYLSYYGAHKESIYIYPFTTMREEEIIKTIPTRKEKIKLLSKLDIPYSNIVLSVGRFIESKGFDTLIKASVDFSKDIGVYIIGGTPTKEYLDLINVYNLNNIHFIKFLEYEELKKYYLAADLFVLPTRSDVWGLVVNEAMANGLPVVTTTSCVAGIEMIEEGKNGYLIPTDNPNKLAEKTNKIINNKILQKKMSENSIEKASEYTIEKMATVTYKILKDMQYM